MDEKTTRLLTPERILLALGAVVTVTLAVLGWYRLSYGFNFIDEGMYMADAWRMAAGDRLFPDNSTSVVRLYVVFNELIFRLFPDATLLFFRQLQYGLSLISMMAVAFAAWRWVRSAWVVVLALSLFAYTGLDPNGLPANLSYYVYPHAFLALHVALLLLALDSERSGLRVALLVASGTSLWAMGFSLLPLSAAAAAPVVLWGANRLLKAGLPFGRKEVVLVLAPVAIGWVFALALMGGDFFSALTDMRRYFAEGDPTVGALSNEAVPYYAIIGAYLVLILAALRLPGSVRSGIIGLLAVAFFAVSDTNALGLIPYYWRGWFAEPMWLAALLGTGLLLTALHLAWRSLKRHPLDRNEQFLLAVLVPCALVAALFSYFSGMGRLATNHTALLSTVLVAVFLVQRAAAVNGTTWLKAGVVLATLFPIYQLVTIHHWKFNYFDFGPGQLDTVIEGGFGKGIRTNGAYAAIATWMKSTAEANSRPGDFAIAEEQVPMTYMLIQRRPALNHSWTGMANSPSLRREAMAQSLAAGRRPQIAYRFIFQPMMFPEDVRAETFIAAGPKFFSNSDPVDSYIVNNMTKVDTFKVNNIPWVEVYTAKTRSAGER